MFAFEGRLRWCSVALLSAFFASVEDFWLEGGTIVFLAGGHFIPPLQGLKNRGCSGGCVSGAMPQPARGAPLAHMKRAESVG